MTLANTFKLLIACICAGIIFLSACSFVKMDNSGLQTLETTAMSVTQYENRPLLSNAQILFGEGVNLLGGWDHVESYSNEFIGLNFATEAYRVNKQSIPNNQQDYFTTTLVKKFGDWNHQHGNGITGQFSELAFSEIAGVELVLRVESTKSIFPDPEKVASTYGHLVSKEQLETLDDGNVYLSLALIAPRTSEVETQKFHAEYLLMLDTKTHIDQWLRIFIPVSDLVLYNEVNYKQTPVSSKKAKTMVISDFRLMAETRSTQVIRNLIPDTFSDEVPKLFKEIGMDIKYISVVINKH